MEGSRRGWKICAAVTGILFIIILVVLLVLFLTVLKIREPDIVATPLNLESYEVVVFPTVKVNVTMGVLITVKNNNYGSFKYHNTTTYMSYRGTVVGEAPFKEGMIPARKKHNITTSLEILADRLASDSHFLSDYSTGVLNFTSHTVVHGKGSLLIFKKNALIHTDCNISIVTTTWIADSACESWVKLT